MVAIPWEAYWPGCQNQLVLDVNEPWLRTVCLECLRKAEVDCWRFGSGRNVHQSHDCNERCTAAADRLRQMLDEAQERAKAGRVRRKSASIRKENAKKEFLEKASQWGADLASYHRRNPDGDALHSFLSAFFKKAGEKVRNRKKAYKQNHLLRLRLRQQLMEEMMARIVRPHSATEMVDDLTAMSSMPGDFPKLVDVLNVLGVISHGREHTRRIRKAVAARIKMERYDCHDTRRGGIEENGTEGEEIVGKEEGSSGREAVTFS